MPCLKPSLEQDGNLGPTPLGLETALHFQPRAAVACGGIGKTLESSGFREFRRCTGRLNATQPGVLAVSPSYIRGLGSRCKGSEGGVAARQHRTLFVASALGSH